MVSPEIQALTLSQLGKLVAACNGERLEALFVTTALTGAPFGEQCRLRGVRVVETQL